MGKNSRSGLRHDFAVYDDHGGLSAVLEVKRRFATTSAWAQGWHTTRFENTEQPPGASVILITPERIYAWHPGASSTSAPDRELDAEPWFAPYFERLKISVAEVHPHIFEQIVGMWLRDVAQQDPSEGAGGDGLFELLRGGRVVEQDAA